MRLSHIALAITLALSACTQAPDKPASSQASSKETTTQTTAQKVAMDESARLNQWFDTKYEAEVLESPINLTYLGTQ